MAQSTSCALPSSAVCRASASRLATRRRGVRGGAADQGQLARVAQRGGQRLRRAVLARTARRPPAAPGAAARRPSASVPPSGPVEQLDRGLLVQRSPGCSAQRSSRSSGRAPGSAASGSSSPATTDGHPGRGERPAQQRHLADGRSRPGPPWTTRARRPCRCARRSASAITAASWLALEAITTRIAAGDGGAAAIRAAGDRSGPRLARRLAAAGCALPGWPPGWPSRGLAVSGLLAPRRAGREPARDPARRGEQDGAAAPAGPQGDDAGPDGRPACGTASGNRMIALTSAPRNA